MSAHTIGDTLTLLTTNTFSGRCCDFGTTAPAVAAPCTPQLNLRAVIEETVRATLAALACVDSDSDSSLESDCESDSD